ncbi:MAG: DNA repair protein RecN [Acutalibacteraceae bacterium]
MLSTLYIENIAVIEKISIDFKRGLNVLTGETGAGKSIIIDSICAVLGRRTSKDLIRTGAEKAFVSALFENVSENVLRSCNELGFESEDGSLFIQREISKSGKNSCRINGRPSTVSILKEIGAELINIHGQHESYELMSPDLHINYIDNMGGHQQLLSDYSEAYSKYKAYQKQLSQLSDDESKRMHEIDLLTYQINELTEADLGENELEQLNEERMVLLNSEKIARSLYSAKQALEGDDDYTGACDALENVASSLNDASRFSPQLEQLASRVLDLSYELRDCCDEVDNQIELTQSNPQRLEEIEERLDILYHLSKKYGSTTEEMIDFLNKATERLQSLISFDENKTKLEQSCKKAYDKALSLAQKLSQSRKKVSEIFSQSVQSEMAYLDMPKVRIFVSTQQCELYEKGIDKIELLISANPGEEPKPVSKIASGGELSRMMLAIKSVLTKYDTTGTLIFDEVDTGISGSASQKVGQKLKNASADCQVLCITHQAQIAAFADSHYLIQKQFEEDKTYTTVTPLDYNGRVAELARIISGDSKDETAVSFAKQLIKNS